MKPKDLTDDQIEEFLERLYELWEHSSYSTEVCFKEIREFIPIWDHRWDEDFEFLGKNATEMAENFFDEFEIELYKAVLEQREAEEDFHNTDNDNAKLRY